MELLCRLKKDESLRLDDSQKVWFVEQGNISLSIAKVNVDSNGAELFTVGVGEAIFGVKKLNSDSLILVAIATETTELREIDLDNTATIQETEDVVLLYEQWLEKLRQSEIPNDIEIYTNLSADLEGKVNSYQSQAAVKQKIQQREQLNNRAINKSLIKLVSAIDTSLEAVSVQWSTPLLVAAGAVARVKGISLNASVQSLLDNNEIEDPVQILARASRFRTRRVILKSNWWQQEHDALLGFMVENKLPVALLPNKKGYTLFNPQTKNSTLINQTIATSLAKEAYQFYRPLPNKIENPWSIVRFAINGLENNLGSILIVGIVSTIIGMIVPQATRLLVDRAIGDRDLSLLWQLGLGLLAVTLGKTTFALSQGIIALRVETGSSSTLQLGVWDKLLRLSPTFFRKYSSGDLLNRALSIKQIYQILSGGTRRTLFSGLFALLNLVLMWIYSWQLALVAIGIALLAAVITISGSLLILPQLRRQQELSGEITRLTVELINGISKLKVALAEKRAFSTWIELYAEQIKLKNFTQRIKDIISVFNEISALLNSAFLYLIAVASTGVVAGEGLTIGTFLAFNAALGIFLGGVTDISNTATDILTIYPLWQRAKPILQTEPEYDISKVDPGVLQGGITLEEVTFSYKTDSPPVLKKISMVVEPGEFIALVGESGSGKSTVLRLLLGFETPQSGTVSYDNKDLAQLDLEAVRRQLGVVLQNGRISPGSIYENIAVGALILQDEAWLALQMAGLAEDVRAMPMGLHTVISEGGSNLSGGQRQRLLIARALVRKPKIILMDEATSALDDRTQNIVTNSLDKLAVTRIVVAHRLSTIRNANRIYVFNKGQVAQVGNFDRLMQQEGLFLDLVKSQLD